ncbi:MAG: VWA domain-containing protein [Bacteroidaceae bacterium]|nr:VWA domain-containing protein [Bacteroidaceae bacterium]
MKNHVRILVLLAVLAVQSVYAQRERNYIYLLDCTKSMTGYNGSRDIWESTKKYLRSDIERQTRGTMVHVVPFQGKVLPPYSFPAQDFRWDDMESDLDQIVGNVTNTNICDAWKQGQRYIDQNKDNYIYLLTDGIDNCQGIDALARELGQFCGKYRNTRAFYVVLTEDAKHPKVKDVVDNCPDEQFIDASTQLDPFGCLDSDVTIYANTLNLDKVHKVLFSAAGEFPATAVCEDENFGIEIVNGVIKDGVFGVRISARRNLQEINTTVPDRYVFHFNVEARGVQIVNPSVKVVMTNKPEREFETIIDEQDMGEAEWYDSFLFCGAKTPDTLLVDLKAVFNSEAKKDGSRIRLKIEDPENLKDFTLLFNGKELEDGTIRCDAADMPESTFLGVVFDTGAKEGKRYLRITATEAENLEKANAVPVRDFEVSLRSEYDVVWNPLKTILVWLLIIMLGVLVLWFVILKRIFFPTFSVGSVMVTDPYFVSIRIKGARKLIFSNRNVPQSPLSRIFTGRVICNVSECWTQPLVLEPSKKAIRPVRSNTYVFDPYTSRLTPQTEYTIENTETGKKISLTIQ